MPVIVYGSDYSPPVRSVLLTARAIDLDIDYKIVDMLHEENKSKAFLKKNPMHTIPVIDDDGFYLSESRAIMTYLVEQYAKDDRLYPKDIKKRALVDNMLYYDASALNPSIVAFLVPVLFQGKTADSEKKAAMIEKIGIVNTILGQQPYFAGDHLTVADLSLINTLTFPEFTYNFNFDAYPNIKKWMTKIKTELPFYEEVSKNGIEMLKSFAANLPSA